MDPRAFERLAKEELAQVPPRFARRIENVAILIEDEPSPELMHQEGLGEGEVLLGLYHGIPKSERGPLYSGVLPDTITLYRVPLLEEAEELVARGKAREKEGALRLAIRETLWHELGHHFGLSESAVAAREGAGTNNFTRTRSKTTRSLDAGARRSRRGLLLAAGLLLGLAVGAFFLS